MGFYLPGKGRQVGNTYLMLTAAVSVFFMLCSVDGDVHEGQGEAMQGGPDQEWWDFFTVITKDGLKQVEVTSGYSAYYTRQGIFELSDSVVANFYGEDGTHASHLTSNRARVDEKKEVMTAKENVVVISDAGETLLTSELSWEKEKERIFTDKQFTFVTKTDTFYGTGFESDRFLKNYKLKNVSGVTRRVIKK